MDGRKTETLVLGKQGVNTCINNFIIIFIHYETNQPPPFSNRNSQILVLGCSSRHLL